VHEQAFPSEARATKEARIAKGAAMSRPERRGGARSALRRFLDNEALGGLILVGAAALALALANSGAADAFDRLLRTGLGPALSPRLGPMSVHAWINDGLMALFFLLVGLEIKREFRDGELAAWDKRRLPLIAAAAGMAMPALVYLAFVGGEPALARGWAIPAATDIAFALGVLALLGSRVPASLKLFLATVAIADDLGAVAIIAFVYTETLDLAALAIAAAVLAGLFALARSGVTRLSVYLCGAALLWYFVLLSGVHPTIAGVLAAAAVPIGRTPGGAACPDSALHRLEHGLSPWVAFLIVPLFALANAGVSLEHVGLGALVAPLPLAIAAGLFAGKQAGIFAAVRISVRFGLARAPTGATWAQIYGVAMLCGVGFTMSLFIGALAFPGRPDLAEQARIGILAGSFASALAGYALLRLTAPRAADVSLRDDPSD
jgi:NhaA family Na+:H+ antiporter